jgi:formylglycine-generating enzyme required for sulfatase activity
VKAARGGLDVPLSAIVHSPEDGFARLHSLVKNPEGKRFYPWEEGVGEDNANSHATNIGTTSAVGCFAHVTSPYGVQEMAGNVWEWVEDHHQDPKDQPRRLVKGGAFDSSIDLLSCDSDIEVHPANIHNCIGFRLVIRPTYTSP